MDNTTPTIDTPPTLPKPVYHSSIGRAVASLRAGQRIPRDTVQDLMDQGIDLPSLTARHACHD